MKATESQSVWRTLPGRARSVWELRGTMRIRQRTKRGYTARGLLPSLGFRRRYRRDCLFFLTVSGPTNAQPGAIVQPQLRRCAQSRCYYVQAAVAIQVAVDVQRGSLPVNRSSISLSSSSELAFASLPRKLGFLQKPKPCIHMKTWSGRPGSNRRRPAWENGILPLAHSR
jgi:hypothetical protein